MLVSNALNNIKNEGYSIVKNILCINIVKFRFISVFSVFSFESGYQLCFCNEIEI